MKADVHELMKLGKLRQSALQAGRKLKRGTPARKLIAEDVRRYRREYGDIRQQLTGSRFSRTFNKVDTKR